MTVFPTSKRHVHHALEVGEAQAHVAVGDVPGGRDGGLYDDDLGPGLNGGGGEPLGVLGGERDSADGAGGDGLLNAPGDELLAQGRAVHALQHLGDRRGGGLRDLVDSVLGDRRNGSRRPRGS